ncbi:MAG: hypothetical protein ACTS5F_00175 [Candidatus Hodgkinia cicadicola]
MICPRFGSLSKLITFVFISNGFSKRSYERTFNSMGGLSRRKRVSVAFEPK